MTRLFCAVALSMALSTNVMAQVTLKAKFLPGESETKVEVKLEQTMSIAGMDIDTGVENFTTVTQKIAAPDDSGLIKVLDTVKSMQVFMSVMGQEYNFDSANPDATGASQFEFLRDVHKALVGRKTTSVYNSKNEVESVKFDRDISEGLPEQLKAMVGNETDEEYLKAAAQQLLDRLPSESVKKGDTWDRTEKTSFGSGQVMTFQTQYKYDGVVEKDGKVLHKILGSAKSVDFSIEGNPALSLKSSSLKVAASSHEYLFDQESGRFITAKDSLKITGELVLEAQGMELPAELDLEMQSTTTSSLKS